MKSAPARLGAYPLLSVIARGSMGTVYRSVDPRTDRALAIKAVPLDGTGTGEGARLAARLRLEAQTAGGLSHPGIVAIHEYGEEAEHAFAVMEYVEGDSLRQCLERGLRFTPARALTILSQVLEALQYAHERGVCHRDIKPSNILIGRDDQVKLTDFGIARGAAVPPPGLDVILGTPGYIAPESYVSETVDSRVDIFAAGAVLYQLLAGVPAFAGAADQVMFKVCYETPLPPSRIAAVPALELYDAPVMKALQRRPEDRFATAAEFREALRAVGRTRV